MFLYKGTHDAQGLLVMSPNPGDIRVTGDFIQGSTATGVVIADLKSSEIYFYLLTREIEQLELDDTISNLVDGQHTVSAFIVGEQGLPFSRTATLPQSVLVVKGNSKNMTGVYSFNNMFIAYTFTGSGNQTFSIEYELVNMTSASVCILCNFLDPDTSGCVAVVHQQISQLGSGGLMNIESSHRFTRSGDTAYGCIEGVNLEQYQVGVIGGVSISKQITTVTIEGK